jgi:hypothetical protein
MDLGWGARRSGRSCEPHWPIPVAGCNGRDNEAPGRKDMPPEGFFEYTP